MLNLVLKNVVAIFKETFDLLQYILCWNIEIAANP